MSAQKAAANELLKDVEHEFSLRPYQKLRPASSKPLAARVEEDGFQLSMLLAPEALGRVLVMLNDTRGVHSVRLHGMNTVVESTDEVL